MSWGIIGNLALAYVSTESSKLVHISPKVCWKRQEKKKRNAANWDIALLCGPRRTTKHSDHRVRSKWDRKKLRTDVGQTNTSTGRPSDRVMGPLEGFSTLYLLCSCSSGASWLSGFWLLLRLLLTRNASPLCSPSHTFHLSLRREVFPMRRMPLLQPSKPLDDLSPL